MRDYRPLPARILSGRVTIARPPQGRSVSVDSAAIEVMTDLSQLLAAVTEPQLDIDTADKYMIQRGVRLLLVLSHDKGLLGLVTSNDIHGEKPLRIVQERNVRHSEILVADVMTPLADLEAIPMEEVRDARVGHVLSTLRGTGRQHALVVEGGAHGQLSVRGIFSLSQIARQLGMLIQTTEVAKTFAEIEALLMADGARG